MIPNYNVYPDRRQVVFFNNKGAATVSIGTTGELITVDDQDGDNHYIGFSGQRAQAAVERILSERTDPNATNPA